MPPILVPKKEGVDFQDENSQTDAANAESLEMEDQVFFSEFKTSNSVIRISLWERNVMSTDIFLFRCTCKKFSFLLKRKNDPFPV